VGVDQKVRGDEMSEINSMNPSLGDQREKSEG